MDLKCPMSLLIGLFKREILKPVCVFWFDYKDTQWRSARQEEVTLWGVLSTFVCECVCVSLSVSVQVYITLCY